MLTWMEYNKLIYLQGKVVLTQEEEDEKKELERISKGGKHATWNTKPKR